MFNRKALWLASYGEQMIRAREVAAIMAEKLEEAPQGDVGRLLNETLKTLIFDVLSEASLSDNSASMKMLVQAAEALRDLECAREMSVISTHFGDDNPFNGLVNDIRAGRRPYGLLRLDFGAAYEIPVLLLRSEDLQRIPEIHPQGAHGRRI